MTYNVFGGMLNPAQPNLSCWFGGVWSGHPSCRCCTDSRSTESSHISLCHCWSKTWRKALRARLDAQTHSKSHYQQQTSCQAHHQYLKDIGPVQPCLKDYSPEESYASANYSRCVQQAESENRWFNCAIARWEETPSSTSLTGTLASCLAGTTQSWVTSLRQQMLFLCRYWTLITRLPKVMVLPAKSHSPLFR